MQTILTISIPFPAWDGIFQMNNVCSELRRNEMLKGIPVHQTPRRITVQQKGKQEGFDDVKVAEYWFTGGCYATVTLGGHDDDHYGTSWELVEMRLRWKDSILGLPMVDEKIDLRLNAEQLKAISLTSYLRSHLPDYEGRTNYAEAQAHLAEAAMTSDAIIARLAAPIYSAYERQQVWIATLEAEREGREFSWLPGNKPFDPRTLPVPTVVEWKEDSNV